MFPISVTYSQIKRLRKRFVHLDKEGKGHLGREDFHAIPELESNPLGDRIIRSFFRGGDDDADAVSFRDFVRVFAHFRPVRRSAVRNRQNRREDKLRCKWRIELSKLILSSLPPK